MGAFGSGVGGVGITPPFSVLTMVLSKMKGMPLHEPVKSSVSNDQIMAPASPFDMAYLVFPSAKKAGQTNVIDRESDGRYTFSRSEVESSKPIHKFPLLM